MKAFLLAAGKGVRLRPLTNTLPKCLIPILDKPLIEYWFDLFRKYNITDVLINLNYLPEQVKDYVDKNVFDLNIIWIYESELLGSAGTLRENEDFVKGEESFWVFYADNLTNINLANMQSFHIEKNSPLTLALFHTPYPTKCGIAELDKNCKIIDFEEKPQEPKSDLAFAGILIASPEILKDIPKKEIADIGFDLLPKYINHSYGWEIDGFLRDIGTLEGYKQAEKDWQKLINN